MIGGARIDGVTFYSTLWPSCTRVVVKMRVQVAVRAILSTAGARAVKRAVSVEDELESRARIESNLDLGDMWG